MYLFLCSLLLIFAGDSGAQGLQPVKPFERHYQYTATEEDSVYYVDSSLVEIRKVVFTTADGIQINVPYVYQPGSGKVLLGIKPPRGAVVLITGLTPPIEAGRTFYTQKVRILTDDSLSRTDVLQVPIQQSNSAYNDEFTLYRSGSLSRAFSFGTNRGMQLQSGLNMQIQGKLGNDYEIKASLTDQNIPIQPEGNTRTLQEIDRVYMDVIGPGISVRFGDLYLDKSNSQFGNYSRKLTGAAVSSAVKGNNVSLSYAAAQGTYNSIKLMGREGNQGPYLLTGRSGERTIIVVAGTERVYVDGQLMTRGEEYDYIIDYAASSITFTRRRLITADSRIVVDFQYGNENYKKNFYTFSAGNSNTNTGFLYTISFTRESDNAAHPLNKGFTDNDKMRISNAGDNILNAYKSGVEYVGAGNGTYKRVITEGSEYYVYSDSAEYKVLFSDVGEGQGDYVFKRLGVYEYVGAKKGRFIPYIILPIPQSHSVTDVAFGYSLPKNGILVNSEAAYSNFDKNSLSSRDDNDNTGGAFLLAVQAVPSSLFGNGRNYGVADFSVKIRRTDNHFQPVDRAAEVEFDRKWDLDRSTVSGDQSVELETKLTPASFLTIIPSYGFLTLPNGFNSVRKAGTLQMNMGSKWLTNYFVESISSKKPGIDNNWERQKGSMSYLIGSFTPSLHYERESKQSKEIILDGFTFNDWTGKLDYSHKENVNAYILFKTRQDSKYQNALLQTYSRSENIVFHTEMSYGQRLFSQIHYVTRSRTYQADNSHIQTQLADVRVQSSEWDGGLLTRLDCELSREQMPEKELFYIRVEDGRGYYSYDNVNGEYFTDNNGNYELRSFTTDKLHPVNRQKIGLNVSFEPSKCVSSLQNTSFFNGMRTITIFRYDNGKNATGVDMGKSVFKSSLLTQDIYLFEQSDKGNLRLRQNYSFVKNLLYTARNEERKSSEYSVRLLMYPNAFVSAESYGEYKVFNKSIGSSLPVEYSINSLKTEHTLSFKPQPGTRISISASAARESDDESGYSHVHYYGLGPGFEKALLGSGRVIGNIRWIAVDSPKSRYLPYEFAEGNQPGNNVYWNVSIDYRTAQNLITSFRYTGNKTTRYDKIFHNLRAEMQILF